MNGASVSDRLVSKENSKIIKIILITHRLRTLVV